MIVCVGCQKGVSLTEFSFFWTGREPPSKHTEPKAEFERCNMELDRDVYASAELDSDEEQEADTFEVSWKPASQHYIKTKNNICLL